MVLHSRTLRSKFILLRFAILHIAGPTSQLPLAGPLTFSRSLIYWAVAECLQELLRHQFLICTVTITLSVLGRNWAMKIVLSELLAVALSTTDYAVTVSLWSDGASLLIAETVCDDAAYPACFVYLPFARFWAQNVAQIKIFCTVCPTNLACHRLKRMMPGHK